MTNSQEASEFVDEPNQRALSELAWAIEGSVGQFSLILARCNSVSLRSHLVQSLKEVCSVEIREIVLDKSEKTLYATIKAQLREEQPQALIICGLESVSALNQMLTAANQVREEFRKNFHFPLVWWVTDEVLQKLIRLAPDFYSWTTTVEFEISTAELIHCIEQTAEQIFAQVLDVGSGGFLNNGSLNLGISSTLRTELESAYKELQNRGVKLKPELEASLEFVLGREGDGSLEKSRQHLERSLTLWQQSSNLQGQGYLLYCLGIWWSNYAAQHRDKYQQALGQAKDYLQQSVEVFEQSQRPDLVAKLINYLGEVLQRLQQWNELETVANKALTLHQTYPDSFRLARVYGFLAEVKLSKFAWTQAEQFAQQALSILTRTQPDISTFVSSENSTTLDWMRSFQQGWYLFSLAKAQSYLNQPQEALKTLETAVSETKAYYDPELYIQILDKLRSLYFQQGNYLKAFQIKQDRRSIEQQFGFRAFVGAGRLQPKQHIINPVIRSSEPQGTVTQEISASGRQQDVNRLVERIGRNDHKLTVIQGQSGVGKSSIVQAGLIPALKQKSIGTFDVIPVLQQVYPDWIRELGKRLAEALTEMQNLAFEFVTLDSVAAILKQLQLNAENNLLTVLIFDQFEEFFFIYKEESQRLPFYNFLRECLDIPYVKIILSLREDYLYFLLECNERLISLDVINNNILDKNILYYLGNFSPADAKSVIQSLTAKTQFALEPPLIDALVEDLAGELGEIRPIELQVVGAQLQTERITKLEQYQKHGPKERLVERFLEEVVKDCGPENEQIAKLVLYLLTDENNTRPLKTRADLELELDVKADKLDLVLEIFVKSRLVFQVPALPVDRYQLIHDYLVAFVRQQQSARLIEELEKERTQRKLTEEKLNQVLRQQLKSARQAAINLIGLLAIIVGVAGTATIVGINLYVLNLASSSQSSKLESLVSLIKAGKQLKFFSMGTIPGTKFTVLTQLNQALHQLKERNHLQGHTDAVSSVKFSSDGKLIATVSEDNTVKLWKSSDGTLINTLTGHTAGINSVNFSPDGKLLATVSKDKTVKLWSADGNFIKTLTEHTDKVTNVSFSQDSKMLALANKDNTIELWNIDGNFIKTLEGHTDKVTNVSFSHDGKMLASADNDDIVKLWNLNGKVIQSIENDGSVLDLNFSKDNQNIVVTNKNTTIKIYGLDGNLVKNIGSRVSEDIKSISPDGKWVGYVSKSFPNNVNIWKLDGDLILQSIRGSHNDRITNLSFSPDGKLLASASKDKTVKLWNLDIKAFKVPGEDNNAIYQVKFNPDNKTIAAAGYNKPVLLWSRDGTRHKKFPGDGYSVLNFSPDGKTLVTGSSENVLKIASIDGREIPLEGQTGKVTSISFSPDGKTIAASDDKTIKLWNSSNGSFIKTLPVENNSVPIENLSFSPDGKLIACTVGKNSIKLWKKNGKFIQTLKGHSQKIEKITFSPDSQIIATNGDDNLVKLWKRDRNPFKILAGHTSPVTQVIFSPNNKIIASVSQGINGVNSEIKIWGRDGNLIKTNPITTIDDYGIKSISFSPDSSIVASINLDNTVKLWSLEGKLLKAFKKHSDSINSVSFSPDSKTIASASDDQTIKIWQRDGSVIKTLRGHSSKVQSASFTPDGQLIVSVSSDNMVKLWRSNGDEIKTLQPGDESVSASTNKISFSKDSKFITLDSTFIKNSERNRIVKIWNREGKELKSVQDSNPNQVSFSPNGKSVALAIQKNAFKLWNLDNGSLSETLPEAALTSNNRWNNNISFSADSNTIAYVSENNTVKIFKRDKTQPYTLKELQEKVNSVSISPDGQTIASASDDKTIKLWHSDGSRSSTFKQYQDKVKVKSVIFSPDGKTIGAVIDNNTVELLRSDGSGLLVPQLKHDNQIKRVIFSPDSKTIATVSEDNTVKIWKNNSQAPKNIPGSSGSPVSLSFSPDSKRLAVYQSGTVTLHLLNGVWFQERKIEGIGSLNDLSFSHDGNSIAAASDDGVLVFSLDLDELLVQSCKAVRGYLNNKPNGDPDKHLCDDIPQK